MFTASQQPSARCSRKWGYNCAMSPEGEPNCSPERDRWRAEHLDETTRHWLDEDARYFLHQSLSTPCLNVLARAQGSWIEDLQGRRFLDFHGNNVHHVGFANPHVIDAIR